CRGANVTATLRPAKAPRPTRARQTKPYLWLLLPGVLGLGLTFILPLLYVVRMSLNESGAAGQLMSTLSLSAYMTALSDPFYWQIIGNTLVLGLLVGILG